MSAQHENRLRGMQRTARYADDYLGYNQHNMDQYMIPVMKMGGVVFFAYPLVKDLAQKENWGLDEFIKAIGLGLIVAYGVNTLKKVFDRPINAPHDMRAKLRRRRRRRNVRKNQHIQ